MSMNFTYRPLSPNWPSGERTPAGSRRWSPFRADWRATMKLLEHEVSQLGVKGDPVFEAGYRPGDIRLDGMPRADARKPEDPGIVVAFESKYGPLRYGCDAFTSAEANIRAIALALEALRKVDRYGVTKRGEQYKGWLQLRAAGGTMSAEEARRWLREQLAGDDALVAVPVGGEVSDDQLLRWAAKRVHPDMPTGSREKWAEYERVKRVLA